MKTKINRSRIFKEAWSRFKACKWGTKFAWFLKKVWKEEKERVAYYNTRNDFSSRPVAQSVPVSAAFIAGAEAYYRENRRYYGD